MRFFLLLLVTFLLLVGRVNAQEVLGNTSVGVAGTDVITKAVTAYNDKDIDAYVACFSPNVKVYNAAGVLLYEGRDKLRSSLEAYFRTNPQARRKVIDRMNAGGRIVEREKITGLKGDSAYSATAVYELDGGLIRSFYLVGEF